MKLITRDTDYALRALCFIAMHKGEVITVSRLVKELKMPQPFLRKLLQILNKYGILKSQKGQAGGFSLAKPAYKIKMADVMKIFQGPLRLNECFLKKAACPQKRTCALRKRILHLEQHVIKDLGVITLASLT